MWDPPDTKSHQSSGTSQDCPGMSWDVLGCPGMSLMRLSGHQVGRMSQDSPGMSLMGLSGHQFTSPWKDVPGQSWDVPYGDVPYGVVRTSSYFTLEGCPRTVLGCPSWDCPDIMSSQIARMSQNSPGMSDI